MANIRSLILVVALVCSCRRPPEQCQPGGEYFPEYGCIYDCERSFGAAVCRGPDGAVVRDASTPGDSASDRSDVILSDVAVEAAADVSVSDTAFDSAVREDPSLEPPRSIAPLSGSRVTSQRPTLRWTNGASAEGATVELSATRDFATIERRLRATGDRIRLPSALSAGVWFWRLRGFAAGRNVEGVTTSAIWWFRVGARSADGDRDRSEGAELDVNGDGYSDLAVGSSGANSNLGTVSVFYGGRAGFSRTPNVVLRGDAAGAQFGASVSSAGDVNGDGFGDLLVGAPLASPSMRGSAGSVAMFHGSASGLSTTPNYVIHGEQMGELLGHALSPAGDVNGDGFADVLIGAPGGSRRGLLNAGVAFVLVGGIAGLQRIPFHVFEGVEEERLGEALGGGDFNGDGRFDFAIGGPGLPIGSRAHVGRVSVFLSTLTGIAAAPSRVLTGELADELVGASIIASTDVDGDGFADLAVGCPGATAGTMAGAGVVRVYRGTSTGIQSATTTTLNGVAAGDSFGIAVTGGDFDGDGYGDVAVGAYQADPGGRNGAGAVSIFRGTPTGVATAPTRTLDGASALDSFGARLATIGDANGDGYSDLATAAPTAARGGRVFTGVLEVFLGGSMGVSRSASLALEGDEPGGVLGASIASHVRPAEHSHGLDALRDRRAERPSHRPLAHRPLLTALSSAAPAAAHHCRRPSR